jgi:hypothetical protein
MPLDTDLILDRIARRLVRLRAISLAHARLLARSTTGPGWRENAVLAMEARP